MGRPRKDPDKVKIVRPKILKKPKVETLLWDEFTACVGDPKIIKSMVEALDDLCENSEIVKLEFIRQCRAFRLYQNQTNKRGLPVIKHMDWINLTELSKLYDMQLPQFKGALRNYQKPLRRIWGNKND